MKDTFGSVSWAPKQHRHPATTYHIFHRRRDALQTTLECPWALEGQWKVFSKGKLASTDPQLRAETYLQTICLLASQLTVYTDGSATAGTRDGGVGVMLTCDDLADPTIPNRSHLRGTVFTSSLANDAAVMQLALEYPASPNTPSTHSQSALTVNRYLRHLNRGLQ